MTWKMRNSKPQSDGRKRHLPWLRLERFRHDRGGARSGSSRT